MSDQFRAYRHGFPSLADDNHQITSPVDPTYNCIGHAAGTTRWWQPLPAVVPGGKPPFWPAGVPREETIDAFCMAYSALGYSDCSNGEFEIGYEKIAIFAKDGVPKHAARQLDGNNWTSKLGRSVDISHSLHDVSGDFYGHVVRYMKRAK
jgi:hypothetical protein